MYYFPQSNIHIHVSDVFNMKGIYHVITSKMFMLTKMANNNNSCLQMVLVYYYNYCGIFLSKLFARYIIVIVPL